jgi:hypothetical protein
MGPVEFGEILIIEFRAERAVKGILLTTPAFLQNIRRPVWFNSSIEGLCADSARNRPRFRNEIAHDSDLKSPTVPR